jgi:uncharacterized protein involved in outer membrane biogenesis
MESRLKRKLFIAGAASVIVLAATVVFLLDQSNRIIKERLVKVLGENFAVEGLSLHWDGVELLEPRFMRDGQVAAQAKRIILKAEILALLKSGLSISGVVLEEPSLTLQVDRRGQWVMPFDIGKQAESTLDSEIGPLSIARIEARGGTVFFQDHRRPEADRFEFRNVHLTLNHVSFPSEDASSTFALQAHLAGSSFSGSLGGKGTIHLKTLAVNGKFEARNLTVLGGDNAEQAARVERARFAAASEGAAVGGLRLSDLVLTKPYLRLETDRDGKMMVPIRTGSDGNDGALTRVEMKNIRIEDGELLYIDRGVTRRPEPNRIEFRNVHLTLDHVSFPPEDAPSTFALQAHLAGNLVSGSLDGKGTIHPASLAVDGEFKAQKLTVIEEGTDGPAVRLESARFAAASEGAAVGGLRLSDLVLTKPYLRLETDREGKLISPLPAGLSRTRTKEKREPSTPVEMKNIRIEDGELLYIDRDVTWRTGPNRIEFRNVHLTLDHVSFPPEDAPSTFALQAHLAGNLVSGSLDGKGTIHLETMAVKGKFEGKNLAVSDDGAPGQAARVERARFTAASEGAAAKGLHLSDLVLTKPYLRLEMDRDGKMIAPRWLTKQREKTTSVEVKSLKIEDGELLYLDGKVTRQPFPVSVSNIELTADQLSLPFGNQKTAYRLSARLPGKQSTGTLTSSGSTVLKTLDTDAEVSLRDLDLTSSRPYWQKEGEVDVSRGFFDLDMHLGIKKGMLSAPGRSVLRELQFGPAKSLEERFLGLPRDTVVNTLMRNDNRIAFDFIVEGSLDNPQYSLRENVVKRMTVGLAKKLGLSVMETGEKVIIKGGELMKGVGDALKQIFK